MNLHPHPLEGLSSQARRFLGLAWLLIGAKCLLVAWAIPHFHVPVHPGWIIGPTLFFAGWVTALWLTHHE